jgi:adenine phosphoribosyltransferase
LVGFCDLDWIQTSNLLSRNQMRYSVAPRGLFALANTLDYYAVCGCKYRNKCVTCKLIFSKNTIKMNLEQYFRDIQDFPKEGILFKDITPLLLNPKAREEMLETLVSTLREKKIDKVVGVESRGFFFGILLAEKLNAGFIPVRKPNKLPFDTISASYELEYGQDILEMHIDAIQKGEKILIHDDVLATGGTAKAVCELVEKLGGEIVQCNFLMELSFLSGREKIKGNEIFAAITY